MSHYCVAVFTKSDKVTELSDLLVKYDEQPDNPELLEWMEKDEEGYYFNPNAKWDGWTIGGRYDKQLKTLNGVGVNFAKVSNGDFTVDSVAHKKAERFWEVYVDHGQLQPGEKESDFETVWNIKYYKELYKTKENYVKMVSSFIPWAFVTVDGVWIEQGKVGWWATSDATNDSIIEFYKSWMKYLAKAIDEDLYITVVDCHI